MRTSGWRQAAGAALMTLLVAVGIGAAAAPGGAVETYSFVPVADASVAQAKPTSNYGSRSLLEVDGSPVLVSYLRFSVQGLVPGTVQAVRLRLRQVGTTDQGGRFFVISNSGWSESSVTWNTRPAIDGPTVATVGRVARNVDVDVPLGRALAGDGVLVVAVESTSTDGSDWASRESATPPRLTVEVAPVSTTSTSEATTTSAEATTTTEATTSTTSSSTTTSPSTTTSSTTTAPTTTSSTTSSTSTSTSTSTTTTTTAPTTGRLTTVAPSTVGNSDPTFYASNHRVAASPGGRRLVVHGRHADGVQLAWSDGGTWSNTTRGDVTDGRLLRATGTGDWPASIVVADDPAGTMAWVVYGNASVKAAAAVSARRVTDLDDPAGPTVGPVVTLATAAEGGGARPDVALERGPDGLLRAAVVWARQTGAGEELMAGWILDAAGAAPAAGAATPISVSDSATKTATVEVVGDRVVVAARSGSGRLRVSAHRRTDPLGTWTTGAVGPAVNVAARPVAVAHGPRLHVALESDVTAHVSAVHPVGDDLTVHAALFSVSDVAQPTLVSTGKSLLVVGVRSDGSVVSRRFTSGGTLEAAVVEIGAEGGGNHAWPNALRDGSRGALRFVVRGPRGSTTNSATAVLSFERPLGL